MKRASLVSVVMLPALAAPLLMAGAQTTGPVGTIRGHVINETTGGSLPGGLEITLRRFQTQDQIEILITTTDPEGQFFFSGLDVGGDWRYLAQVSYQGVVYSRGPLSFQTGGIEIPIEIPIYEVTTDDQAIVDERVHILVDPSGAQLGQSPGLRVTEVHVFHNPGDRTYVGSEETEEQPVVTKFPMPEDSRDWAFEDGTLGVRFRAMNGGFGDREPLWPGTTSVVFHYTVDPGTTGYDLSRGIAHPVASLDVMVVDVGRAVESQRLLYAGKVDVEGQDHLHYVAQDLVPGEHLDLVVQMADPGLDPVASTGSHSSLLPWIVLGGVLITAALAYPFWTEHVRSAAVR